VKGRKRHIITDTNGFLVHAIIHSADIQDRDGAPMVLQDIRYSSSPVKSSEPLGYGWIFVQTK
jgi:putative transposase